MLVTQLPFDRTSTRDGAPADRVGVVASTALVESLYVQLLAQASLPGAISLGLAGNPAIKEGLGCVLMVLDGGPESEAVIARCKALKARTKARIICLYESQLADVVRWTQGVEVFIYLKSTAPFSVIASAVVLASYVNSFSMTVKIGDGAEAEDAGLSKDVPVTNLTARQLDVLKLLAKGYSNKAMAHSLLLSEPTVKLHLASLRRIFNATNRTEVLVKALKLGIPLEKRGE
jgi:DNA-binding NarL/FixJ family response regulator